MFGIVSVLGDHFNHAGLRIGNYSWEGPWCEIDGVKKKVLSGNSKSLGGARVKFYIQTLEGDMEVSTGDWIITGVRGEKYPCKPDIFEETYEPA